MKKFFSAVLCVLIAAVFFGCSMSPGRYSDVPAYENYTDNGDFSEKQAGQLTSAEWNDLKNYDFWQSLFEPGQSSSKGIFSDYLDAWGLETRYLVPVKVVCGGAEVQGAKVKIYAEQDLLLYSAVTDACGNAYLFPDSAYDDFILTAESGTFSNTVTASYSADMEPVEIELDGCETKQELIELMLLIDTTGSMGDEISYLKAELIDVVKRASDFTGAQIKLAILLYRDIGDEYVTRYYDFSTDLAGKQRTLNTVKAGGGGDFPEAVDVALSEAVSKNWSDNNGTKLIFHVLDAPPHSRQENKTLFHDSIKIAAAKGIRLIPVASSGINKLTEFLLRSEAMMSGGRYTFLTDDSGIGGDHLEPTTEEFVVEYLNSMLLRLIKEYYTGIETPPVPYRQQR